MDNKTITILLCDDETDFTQPMGFWFRSKGYSTVSATNGQDALKVIQEQSPDIVFLDLNMPVMDGYETLRQIRNTTKDLPVIIISAYVEDRQRMKELSALGISGVFYKGGDFEDGLSLLEAALRTHKKLKK